MMKSGVAAVGAAVFAVSAAQAQDAGNSLFVTQTGDSNVLSINQSDASGGVIGSSDNPLSQVGEGNQLTIVDRGLNNTVPLVTQDNLISGVPGDGNIAEITLGAASSEAEVSLSQQPLNSGGSFFAGGNAATLTLTQGAAATIQQTGSGNAASLVVDGAGARGAVIQAGNNNVGALTVGGANSVVTLNQTGNGLNSGGVPGNGSFQNGPAGISVLSNGAVVTITQAN